jgi:Histidine kinase-, DNA gyrase B-, and HSP90-like ATPase
MCEMWRFYASLQANLWVKRHDPWLYGRAVRVQRRMEKGGYPPTECCRISHRETGHHDRGALRSPRPLQVSPSRDPLCRTGSKGRVRRAPGSGVAAHGRRGDRGPDTGCGIAAEHLSHLFDPFFTTKGKGPDGGTGLGLALSYGIIRTAKGDIEVESELHQGSTFRVRLPACQV